MSVQTQRRLFTVQEYHLMSDAGVFGDRERVELIEGEIIQMAAIGTRHASCVIKVISLKNLIDKTFMCQWVTLPPKATDSNKKKGSKKSK